MTKLKSISITLTFGCALLHFIYARETLPDLTEVYKRYLIKDYQSALELLNSYYANAKEEKTKARLRIEIGDLYLDKLEDLSRAESIYNTVIKDFPKYPDIAEVYYRLGIVYERAEKFLDAAQAYERVATKYLKSKYANDALDAIERCFKKNYQELVAKIDDYPITQIEFDDRISQAPDRYKEFSERQKLLQDIIDERLLLVEARKHIAEMKLLPDFLSRLEDIRNNGLFQEWYNSEIVEKAKVSESEKKTYYQKNRARFITPERVRAREILVKTLTEAESLRKKILNDTLKFDSIAKEISLAPTKNQGGDLGLFKRGTHLKAIEDVAFKLKPGEISQPIFVKEKEGYLLLKLEEKKPKEVRTLKQADREIEQELRATKTDKLYKTAESTAKRKGNIVIDTIGLKENRDTLAIVYGIPLTKKDLEEQIQKIPPFYRQEFETPEGKRRLLDQLTLQKALFLEVEAGKYWLRNRVWSSYETRKNRMLIDQLRRQETTDKVRLTEKEMQDEYHKTISDFKVPKQVRAKEITVKNPDSAQNIRKMAKEGKISFDSLAKQFSISPTKWSGGDMGYFSPGQKPKEIEEVAFALPKGSVSKVIKQNDTTWTIIKVEDKKDAYTRPFSEVKDKIERKLRREREDLLYKEFLENLRKQAKIEIFLTEEPTEEKPEEE